MDKKLGELESENRELRLKVLEVIERQRDLKAEVTTNFDYHYELLKAANQVNSEYHHFAHSLIETNLREVQRVKERLKGMPVMTEL
mmetsp:Transcript_42439/g.65120  ORF Transcript_42439/g.65120 Transcript_42439/m.65120 type:complete len:86 (+) Transcript_42439:4038-4295(+)